MKHRQHAILFTALVFLSTLALFAQIQPIGVGNAPNDGLGDTLRGAMIKINTNFWWVTNNMVRNVIFTDDGTTNQAGFESDSRDFGVSIGYVSNGTNGGAAVGWAASAINFSAAMGLFAYANETSVSILGAEALDHSVSIGGSTSARTNSIAIGNQASAPREYSVSIGANAGPDTALTTNTLLIHASGSNVGTNALIYGEFEKRLLRVNGNLEFTNGLYSYVGTRKQPLHSFASLMLVGDENLNLASSGTYYQITNYDAIVTNYFSGVATNGVLTNTIAGYYKVSTTCSFDGSGGVNDLFECAVFTNTVECTLVAWHRKTGSQDTGSAGATGIIYLPANTRVDARIQNTAASGTIVLRHFNLTVTTP